MLFVLCCANRAVRDMLAQGVSDPYCRFIPPGEFQSMKKYDVTGVGLNLGTAEEYIKKTVRQSLSTAVCSFEAVLFAANRSAGNQECHGQKSCTMIPSFGVLCQQVCTKSQDHAGVTMVLYVVQGRTLPRGSNADGGVWVVGLSKGSEADRAGIQQGDQLLWVADVELTAVSPFQAATLIAGPDDSSTDSPVTLRVQKADGRVLDITVQRPARYLPSPVSSSLQERGEGRTVRG